MVKVGREDGAAWKSLEHRCPRATAFIKVDHVSGGVIFLIQQTPQKHRCGTRRPWLEAEDMECEDEAEKL